MVTEENYTISMLLVYILIMYNPLLPSSHTHSHAQRFPRFSSWMLLGESAVVAEVASPMGGNSNSNSNSILSPVLTVWVTLFMIYFTNCLADLAAASTMQV
jgi:hypothetical protein